MRTSKSIIIFLSLVSFLSCSTQSDEDGNSTTAVVPVAPSNLTGTVASSTQINLSWSDNSTNESGFKIERKTGSNTYAVIGTTTADITNYSDTGLLPSTTYTYRVYSYNSVGKSLTYSNEINLTLNFPTIITTSISSITNSSAVSGGNISSDGGSTVTARGICWSTNPNPTIALSTKTIDGSGTGIFSSNITGLSYQTTYYVRAYATNSIGTAYGNELSFTSPPLTDIEGNTYNSVTICDKTWMASNLTVSKYTDGTIIPQVTSPTQWASLTTGAWCYYGGDPINGVTYGKLYNWYAVMGIHNAASAANPALRKQLAPVGWHIPTETEWTQLTNCLGGPTVAGGKMKATGTIQAGTGLWQTPNNNATNESGYSGLPGGKRDYDGAFIDDISRYGMWWSSTPYGSTGAYYRGLSYSSGSFSGSANYNVVGYSVRCVKD